LQRLQGRNPASRHSAMVSRNRQFSIFGLRAVQVKRQKILVEVTHT